MSIDKIIAKELRYRYLGRVGNALNERGVTFIGLEYYLKVGSSKFGKTDSVFKRYFGNGANIPTHQNKCLCGHEITQQCYLCFEGSKNIGDIIIVGNQCINKWGYDPAIRGKGVKFKCECCGVTVNKSGIKRHQATLNCRNIRDTASNASTSAGSDEQSLNKKKSHPNDNYIIIGGRVYLKGESPLEGVWHGDHTPFEVNRYVILE